MKLSTQEYKFVCELLYGNVPVDRKMTEESPYFQSNYKRILEEYPKLDASFFEKHKDSKNKVSL